MLIRQKKRKFDPSSGVDFNLVIIFSSGVLGATFCDVYIEVLIWLSFWRFVGAIYW